MLFNSYGFLLGFLPVTWCAYHGLRRLGAPRAALTALLVASLFFYGWWNPRYLALLLALMVANFLAADWLVRHRESPRWSARRVLVLALAGNLLVLGWFKYADFLTENLDTLAGLGLALPAVVLPLSISFFTFQKIALLVDTYQGKVRRLDPLGYGLFVAFFPQLIAGPIVHHGEVMPQFRSEAKPRSRDWALGLSILTIGLAKKVLLADTIAPLASGVFDAAATGARPDFIEAWLATLAYTLQLYFDFSGYSDMAVGAALLFGIRLPVNFASPYRATCIIDFWHRWHMTLSRFLRNYLYIPLGGNRGGVMRRYLNLTVTMILGGLWHGAAWNFVLWGALHAAFLVLNHAWRAVLGRPAGYAGAGPVGRFAGAALTFLAVAVAWVPFRAADLTTTATMFAGLAGLHGVGALDPPLLAFLLPPLLAAAWFTPNTQAVTGYAPPGEQPTDSGPCWGWLAWRPSPMWAIGLGVTFALALLSLSKVSEFLYFQF